jgi:hypothetical protein
LGGVESVDGSVVGAGSGCGVGLGAGVVAEAEGSGAGLGSWVDLQPWVARRRQVARSEFRTSFWVRAVI